MSSLKVDLAERSYPIHISANLLRHPDTFRAHIKGQRVVIVTNQVVDILFGALLCDSLRDYQVDKIVLPDGEQYKTLDSFESVIGKLLALRASRDTTLIALGGGVIGDLTGFVAACYQRGVPFIQVPTTLLSQVDSSVGGKTAVNHALGKNMIGAFYQPAAVVIDTLTLSSLPKREFAAGMAEVIKYGIIYDKAFFEWLEANQQGIADKQQDLLQQMIRRCCEIKAEIVAQDERESGIRALLNLGHTFGHAIEAEMGYGQWLHGEAVSAGIVLASQVAQHNGWLAASEVCRIQHLLAAFGLPTTPPATMGYDAFMRHMQLDKKVQANKIRFVIPREIGHALVTDQVDEALLRNILDAS